eukprot:c3291_g1_i1.p2 GENE.c3291_g1_i1~~c3291_g1_i1.p2  ORF type:complete len:352 (+),score=85.07 c3291_g1_i1:1-1056(+)
MGTSLTRSRELKMLSSVAVRAAVSMSMARAASTSAKGFRVAVAGAAGGIGQPLSMLLKNVSQISELNLYDIVNTPGVAADISHIPTRAKVTGFAGKDKAFEAFQGADCVVIPAGVPRKPGMTRDDLFNTNASIVASLADVIAKACPNAFVCIISNPVNSTVPIVAERLKKAGVYNARKLFGVTTLDVLRANTFIAAHQNIDPTTLEVTVIGGHAGTTILPLLSQIKGAAFSAEDVKSLTHRIQFGGDEVVKAKDGAGSATLSMAVAGARFTSSLLRAASGQSGVTECAFVESSVVPNTPFFASRVALGASGAELVHGLGKLSAAEQASLDAMIGDLRSQIAKGVEFARNMK